MVLLNIAFDAVPVQIVEEAGVAVATGNGCVS
jgi:hypothetical protein